MKAQVSIEHLLIVGIAVFILIPATLLFYNYAKSSNEDVVKSQIARIGDIIIFNAETMDVLGRGSRIDLAVNIPDSVNAMYVQGGELVFEFSSLGGDSTMLFFTQASIEGMRNGEKQGISEPFHTGLMKIRIENMGDYILIRETY